jgi:Sigma-54, DNA binding domain
MNRPQIKLSHNLKNKTSMAIMGGLKLAHMSEMPEEEFEELLKDIEKSKTFKLLKASGAIGVLEFSNARYSARNFAGYNVRLSSGNLPELADGKGDMVCLMQSIGQEKFEELFLRDSDLNDAQRAEETGISIEDAVRLRDFVNKIFIQSEFEDISAPLPEKVFSSVAGIEIEDGEPIVSFFNREIWKGRSKINEDKLDGFLNSVSKTEKIKAEKILKRLEFAEKRKTSLYKALEILMNIQSAYLLSGETVKRRPLSQKTLAKNLEIDKSVLNRLVSNKSLQLPWGMEAPMVVLLPSSKEINKERLSFLIESNSGLSAEKMRLKFKECYGVELSRRSIAQYIKELNSNL